MKRSPLRRVSKKRVKVNAEYMRRREKFLFAHPYCQWWLNRHGFTESDVNNFVIVKDGTWCEVPAATEVHHRKGRGKYLLDESTWLAVSNRGHRWIHDHTKESYDQGFMLPRN